MKKLTVVAFLSLDGVMQAPGGPEEDTSGGFQYGGWQMGFKSDFDLTKEMSSVGAFLLGRKTYDIFSKYWPTEGKDMPFWGQFMNKTPKYVASKTLDSVKWQNSQLLGNDIAKSVTELKKESGGDIITWGSSDFCQTLMKPKLVDEYFLMIHPVVLGGGKRLFHDIGPKQDLEVVKSQTDNGILISRYKVKR